MNEEIKSRIEQIQRGEVPDGYKKTKVGIVPAEWTETKVGNCIVEYSEKTTVKNQYPVLTSSRKGLMLQSEYYSDNQVTTDDNIGYNVIPRNYITYRSRSDDGRFRFNKNTLIDKGIISYFYPVFSFNSRVDPLFMLELLNFTIYRQSYSFVEGTAQQVLSLNKLCSLKYCLPPLPEQEKIAEILTAQDQVIKFYEKKIEQLKKLKKAFLQKMFPKPGATVPEWRFPGFSGAWEMRRFGDFMAEFSNKTKKENEYPLLSSTNKGMELRNGRVSGESNIGYKIIEDEDLVLSPQNLWLGNINVNRIGKGIVSPSYKTFKITGVFTSFVEAQLKRKHFLEVYKNASTLGASVVRRNLDMDLFFEIEMLFPSPIEQKKVGDFFAEINNLITLHQCKCDEEKQKKKALMQLLLTGIVRVK